MCKANNDVEAKLPCTSISLRDGGKTKRRENTKNIEKDSKMEGNRYLGVWVEITDDGKNDGSKEKQLRNSF